MRSLCASIIAAISVRYARRSGRRWQGPGPTTSRSGRDHGADPVPDSGVDDGVQITGPGQIPLADRSGQDLPSVQAAQLRVTQGPPQPFRLLM